MCFNNNNNNEELQMAYPRLIEDCTKVHITSTKTVKQVLTLKDGSDKNFWKSELVTIANIPVTQAINTINALDLIKAKEIQNWLDSQLLLIKSAFERNAANGIYGGQPVIKRYKTDHDVWGKHTDYIANCKSGEFLGIIKNTTATGKCSAINKADTNKEAAGFVRKLRAEGRLNEIGDAEIKELLEIVHETNGKPGDALTKEEGIALYFVERKFQFLLKGLKIGVQSLPASVKKQADCDWKEFKQSKLGYILEKDKTIPELMAEFNSM
jgi:hypothetical protein